MCTNTEMAMDFRKTADEWVLFTDHFQIEGIGPGPVKIKLGLKKPGREMTLRTVLDVSGMSANLASQSSQSRRWLNSKDSSAG